MDGDVVVLVMIWNCLFEEVLEWLVVGKWEIVVVEVIFKFYWDFFSLICFLVLVVGEVDDVGDCELWICGEFYLIGELCWRDVLECLWFDGFLLIDEGLSGWL